MPHSLEALLDRPPAEIASIDLGRMGLLCAQGLPGAEALDVRRLLNRLDQWAAICGRVTAANRWRFDRHPEAYEHSEPYWRLLSLTTIVQQRFRVGYSQRLVQDWNAWDWKDPSEVLLHGLLGPKRHGTCNSLPVLLIAIGRRLGYPLCLVHAPGHAFCRWDGLGDGGHDNPAWRESRNCEFHGKGMCSDSDEYYCTFPVTWPDWLIREEQQRPASQRLYLRSLTPAEELAAQLAQRAHVLEAHGRLNDALDAYGHALRYAPHNAAYRSWMNGVAARLDGPRSDSRGPHAAPAARSVTTTVRLPAATGQRPMLASWASPTERLRRWGLEPTHHAAMLRAREQGAEFLFPWERRGGPRQPYPPGTDLRQLTPPPRAAVPAWQAARLRADEMHHRDVLRSGTSGERRTP